MINKQIGGLGQVGLLKNHLIIRIIAWNYKVNVIFFYLNVSSGY